MPFRNGLIDYLNGAFRKLLEQLRTSKVDDELGAKLEQAIKDYKTEFLASRTKQAGRDDEGEAGEN